MNRRSLRLLLILVMVLIGADVWAWSALQTCRQSAMVAEQDASRCRQLTDDIKRLKIRPAIAGSHEIELTELSKRIEQASLGAAIPAAALIRIAPESARPLALGQTGGGYGGVASTDLHYLEKPTTVLLTGVTLPQVAQFLYSMSTGPSAMDVRAIRLSAPRQEENGDRWTAEVTLSYLIYVPHDETGLDLPRQLAEGRPNSTALPSKP